MSVPKNKLDKPVVFVGGIDEKINEDIILSIFSSFGEIRNIKIPVDEVSKRKKDFCFIEFDEEDDCVHAIDNMNNSEVFGKVIKVNYARESAYLSNNKIPVWKSEEYQQGLLEGN